MRYKGLKVIERGPEGSSQVTGGGDQMPVAGGGTKAWQGWESRRREEVRRLLGALRIR